MARPMLMMLSAIMPSPTQRFIPASPLYRQRLRPCRRDADASLAAGPPLLAVAEPALPLLTLALGTLGRAVGNADAFYALGSRCCLVLGGVECGIRCHHVRRTPQHCSMRLDGGNQQVRIARTPIIDLVIDHDLVLSLLQLHHLAELVRLACLALADDLRRWLEHAEELAFGVCVAAEDARSRLLHHLPDQRHHGVEPLAEAFKHQLLQNAPRALRSSDNFFGEPLRLSNHPAGRIE